MSRVHPQVPFLGVPLVAAMLVAVAAHGSPQLIPQMRAYAPPSWAAAAVPRTSADADSAGPVLPSDSLHSDRPTYINWSTWKNPAVCGTWTDLIQLDGQPLEALGRSSCVYQEQYFPAVNQGPTYVRGGRHELYVQPDVYLQVANDHSFPPTTAEAQYVWSPMPLTNGWAWSTSPPPPRGDFPQLNCDGYEFDRANTNAWVMWGIATPAAIDVDLVVYDDPWQGGNSGFSHIAAVSSQGAGQTEFVVGSSSPSPAPVFPAMVRASGAAGGGGYSLGWNDATGRRAVGEAVWPGQSMGSVVLANVYEVFLEAGTPTPMDLTRIQGSEDLSFAVFPPTPGGAWSRAQALATATPIQGEEYDALTFTPAETGWHPIVVYRTTYEGSTPGYNLRVGPSATIGVAGGGAPGVLFLSAAAPNPAAGRTRFRYGLAAAGDAWLTIHDTQGRRVRELVHGRQEAGAHALEWDLRDDSGRPVGPGLYWAALETAGRRLTRRLVVAR